MHPRDAPSLRALGDFPPLRHHHERAHHRPLVHAQPGEVLDEVTLTRRGADGELLFDHRLHASELFALLRREHDHLRDAASRGVDRGHFEQPQSFLDVLLRDVRLEAHLREGFAHARDRLELRRTTEGYDLIGQRYDLIGQRVIRYDDVAYHVVDSYERNETKRTKRNEPVGR